jgi:hypothetical protein
MLNPWGDLITMARAWCLVKPGGRALVGVPSGPDIVVFNSHRIYGPVAYSHLFANWEQVSMLKHFFLLSLILWKPKLGRLLLFMASIFCLI